MKLKTSFFNPTVLKKDITRFAPLWGLYTVLMLMTLFLWWANFPSPRHFAQSAPYITQAMGAVNLIYAGICAIMLFGDLFTSKMAGMLHAMPLRREGWFLTHLTAGMLFCLVPNALGAVIAGIALQQYCYLAFIWLAVMILQFMFFFAVGAFSAQCAGTKLGAASVYTLINFLAVLVGFLVETFYEPVLHGVVMNTEEIFRGAPVVDFCCSKYMDVAYNYTYDEFYFNGLDPQNWQYLWIAFAVGIVLLGASVVLYRRRQLECAGDFIALRPAAPVFLILYALSVGAVLYQFADLFETGAEYVFLVIGFAIGIFTGHMLLEKKVNVFQWKKWVNFGILTAVFFLSVAIVTFDTFGITWYVPETDEIKSVAMSPYDFEGYDDEVIVLTDSQDIQTITDIHRVLTENRGPIKERTVTLNLRYTLTSGRRVTRSYEVPASSEEAQTLKAVWSRFTVITDGYEAEELQEKLVELRFYSDTSNVPDISFRDFNMDESYGTGWTIVYVEDLKTAEEVQRLIAAVQADCEAGNMAQQWDFHQDEKDYGTLELVVLDNYEFKYISIRVFDRANKTIGYLKTLATMEKMENQ